MKDYRTWQPGQELIDVQYAPRRTCTLIEGTNTTERPRICVRYDDGEVLDGVHPGHYLPLPLEIEGTGYVSLTFQKNAREHVDVSEISAAVQLVNPEAVREPWDEFLPGRTLLLGKLADPGGISRCYPFVYVRHYEESRDLFQSFAQYGMFGLSGLAFANKLDKYVPTFSVICERTWGLLKTGCQFCQQNVRIFQLCPATKSEAIAAAKARKSSKHVQWLEHCETIPDDFGMVENECRHEVPS